MAAKQGAHILLWGLLRRAGVTWQMADGMMDVWGTKRISAMMILFMAANRDKMSYHACTHGVQPHTQSVARAICVASRTLLRLHCCCITLSRVRHRTAGPIDRCAAIALHYGVPVSALLSAYTVARGSAKCRTCRRR
jgi:hypothetical protein